jgi:hypothetical protein
MASADPRDPQYGVPFVPTGDVQTITISGVPTGGTYKLTFAGTSTANLAYNANAAAVQAALRTLTGDAALTVTGTGPLVVHFAANGLQGDITATAVALTGGTAPAVAVVHTTHGTPVLGSTSRSSGAGKKTVLNMYALKSESITTTDSDNHYTANGALYHE